MEDFSNKSDKIFSLILSECPKIIRALNYPNGVPGQGEYKIELEDGRTIIIIQVLLRLFMGLSIDDPFSIIEKRLKKDLVEV